MSEIFQNTSAWLLVGLFFALLFVLFFEFINGFHDTANAVATVIYTNSMPAKAAVLMSGVFNFLGVLLGGVGVAYSIVHLLPVELLVDSHHGLIMVFSIVASAIAWNLGTWYFGIPASSSHALIGSILGVALANAIIKNIPIAQGVNWQKTVDIALSLLISPVAGFALAGLFLIILKVRFPKSKMHQTPEKRKEKKDKKKPPFWNRVVLILSAMGVSFVHGSNDGQKGIGLVMLVLISFVPQTFVLDLNSSIYQIEKTRDAAKHLQTLFITNQEKLAPQINLNTKNVSLNNDFVCSPDMTGTIFSELIKTLGTVKDYQALKNEDRILIRHYILCLDDVAKNITKATILSEEDNANIMRLRNDLKSTTEYAPLWVIIAVALALGVGTMVGWRRVVLTVGEKIGKQGMTYAQGMCAQITAIIAIGVANVFSLPVSTTHILSSGVAGTMVANKSGLQKTTVINIILAWVLTLPAVILMGALFFWISSLFI